MKNHLNTVKEVNVGLFPIHGSSGALSDQRLKTEDVKLTAGEDEPVSPPGKNMQIGST